jgi:hypothetical protein
MVAVIASSHRAKLVVREAAAILTDNLARVEWGARASHTDNQSDGEPQWRPDCKDYRGNNEVRRSL